MKKPIYLCFILVLLTGCGSKSIPDWTYAAFNQLESFKKNYLEGNERVAELHFRKATEEIKKSGDMSVLARAYLTKYALHVALLEPFDDREYEAVAVVAPDTRNKEFHLFLKGDFHHVQTDLLPERYHRFMKTLRGGKGEEVTREIAHIEEPLSRLVAVGLRVKQQKHSEEDLRIAIDTASRNGWKKALIVYLEKLQLFYEGKGEKVKAVSIGERLRIIRQ